MSEMPSAASIEIDPTRYMLERVDFKIDLYQKLSRQQKNRYYVVSALAIILAAIVPVAVNVFVANTLIPTLLSLLVTILVGLEKLFLFREHWKNYDLAEESLRKEKYLFQAMAGAYAGQEDNEAFRLFVENFEARIHQERAETIEARTKGFDQPGT
jgi:hypothetical protein